MIVAVLATALGFGACSQRKETVTTSAGTIGYNKYECQPQPLKNFRKPFLLHGCMHKQTGATCDERRRDGLKLLKMIMIVAVLFTALGLGACAQHKEVMPPPQ